MRRSWRVALRIAVREARLQRARSVTVLLALALPVTAVTAADVVIRSDRLSAVQTAQRQVSGVAALVTWSGYSDVEQDYLGNPQPTVTPSDQNPTGAPVPNFPAALLPAGARAAGEADAYTFLDSKAAGSYVTVRGADFTAPGPRDSIRVRAGRVPATDGEVALSPPVERALGVRIGQTVSVPGTKHSFDVVGTVVSRYSPSDVVAFATQSAGLALQSGSSALGPPGVRQWYVSSPSPLGWPQVLGFNHEGWSVISRFLIEHPHLSSGVAPAQSPYSATTHSLGVTRTLHPGSALLVAMLVLEVILVCGPAFAIGARRRRHELAVIGAAGARPRDLAAIVASDGLVLGVAAAVVGAAAGIATGAAALAGLRAWTDRVPGPLTVRWSDVVGIGLLAVVSGLVGAIIPAVATSRAPLSQVLRGRQAPARLSPRWAVVGAATLSLAIAMVAATLGERSSGGIPVPLVGAVVLAELGIALLTPALLAGAGRLAGRLPLWARMTVRDSSRNRSAAAPAVAAVMAVAAACSTALVYGSSQVVHDRLTYTGSLPTGDGVVWLSSANNGHPADPATVLADVRSALPQAAVSELLTSDGQRHVVVVHPLAAGCTPPQLQVGNGGFSSATGTGCGVPTQPSSGPDYLVDDGAFLSSLLGGQEGGEAADALRSGKAVVFDPTLVGAGRVSLAIGPGSPASADLPAFVAPWPYGASTAPASIVLPPGVAGRLHLSYAPGEIYIRHAAAQPRSGIRAADAALAGMGMQGIFVQAAYSNRIDSLLLGIVGADLLLAFAVAVAATALLVLESKPDLQVLAAVGAPPGGRRRLSVTRAGFICGLGSILGAGMGTVAGAALVWRVRHLESGPGNSLTGTYPLSLPWLHLLAVLVVPTAVAAAAALLIRGPRLDTELRRVG